MVNITHWNEKLACQFNTYSENTTYVGVAFIFLCARQVSLSWHSVVATTLCQNK